MMLKGVQGELGAFTDRFPLRSFIISTDYQQSGFGPDFASVGSVRVGIAGGPSGPLEESPSSIGQGAG